MLRTSRGFAATLAVCAALILSFNNTVLLAYSGGNGDSSTPYLIANADDLLQFSTDSAKWDRCFQLTADIDMQSQPWTPVAAFSGTLDGRGHSISNLAFSLSLNTTEPFNGGLIGQLQSAAIINDLIVEDCNFVATSTDDIVLGALVGHNEGTIERCGSTGDISAVSTGHNGIYQALSGGLIGDNDGEIRQCYADVNVYSQVVDGPDLSYRNESSAGGLVGGNGGVIEDCLAMGDVRAIHDNAFAGGLAAWNTDTGTIRRCYATGNSDSLGDFGIEGHGGLLQWNGGQSVEACFWDADASGVNTSDAGTRKTTEQMKTQSTFSDAGWDFNDIWTMSPPISEFEGYPILQWQSLRYLVSVQVQGPTDVNENSTADYALIGYYNDGSSDDLTALAGWTLDDYTYADVNSGHLTTSFVPSDQPVTIYISFSSLSYTAAVTIINSPEIYAGGSGTEADPYIIKNHEHLFNLSQRPQDYDKYFELASDIDLAGLSMPPIGPNSTNPFTGFFDGQAHNISNLTIHATSGRNIGLFGYIDGGHISRIRLINADITAQTPANVGALAGSSTGLVSGCYVTTSVHGDSQNLTIGGLVGSNSGTVLGSKVDGSITVPAGAGPAGLLAGINHNPDEDANIIECSASGQIQGPDNANSIGGLCGTNGDGLINDSTAAATVTTGAGSSDIGGLVGISHGRISSCSATGPLTTGVSSQFIGALAGLNRGAITDSYAIVDVNTAAGSSIVGGLAGMNSDGGVIDNCFATANNTALRATSRLGGLVGFNLGAVNNSCATDFTVHATEGAIGAGGLIGYNSGPVTNCYAKTNIDADPNSNALGGLIGNNSGSVVFCYSAGAIVAGPDSNDLGGLVGVSSDQQSPGDDCFWDIDTSGLDHSDGGVGLATQPMTDANTYISAGWDFVNESANGLDEIWTICQGLSTPRLCLQIPPADFTCPEGVDNTDYATLAGSWLTTPADTRWNPACDLDGDRFIGPNDLKIFSGQWLSTLAITTPFPQLYSGIIAYWPMDDSAPNTEVLDVSGRGHHGVAQRNTDAMHVDGILNGALAFDGLTDYITVPDSPDWNLQGDFSIMLWVRFSEISPDWWRAALIGHDEGPTEYNKWIFSYDPQRLRTLFHTNTPDAPGNTILGDQWTAQTDQWFCLALVKSGDQYTFYLNGIPNGQVDDETPVPDADAPLTIGWAEEEGPLAAALDEVMIYDRALTPSQVQALCNRDQQ